MALDLGAIQSVGLDLGAIQSDAPVTTATFGVDGAATIEFGAAPGVEELAFGVDGIAFIEFTPREDESPWVYMDGSCDITWSPQQNEDPGGFAVPGVGAIGWNIGNSFRVDGRASIAFTATNGPGQWGFDVDGESDIDFALQGGVSVECLAPGTALPGPDARRRNYVF